MENLPVCAVTGRQNLDGTFTIQVENAAFVLADCQCRTPEISIVFGWFRAKSAFYEDPWEAAQRKAERLQYKAMLREWLSD